MNPFIWTTPDHFPAPVEISPITGRPIAYRHEWQMQVGISERAQLSPARKGWRTRRGGK